MAHLHVKETVLSDRRLPLPGSVVVLGRSLDADVPVPHASVSRRHALLEQLVDEWVISDLGSVNGTLVDGRRLEPGERASIRIGSSFTVGEVRFILAPDEVIDEEAPAPAAAAARELSLAPAPTPRKTPRFVASPPRAAVAAAPEKAAGRRSSTVAKRAALRKKKRDATRWLGVILTVVLLSFAGYFVSRIVMQGREERAAAPAEETPEKKPEVVEIQALTPEGG